MKLLLLTFLFTAAFSLRSNSAISLPTTSIVIENKIREEPLALYRSFSKMKVKDLEKMTGRKLSLKEKIGFLISKSKIKNQAVAKDEVEKDNGKTSFLLGLLGLICLFIPYLAIASIPLAIIAIVEGKSALRKNPDNRKAKTGIILGWITIALITVALILIVAILSSFSIV